MEYLWVGDTVSQNQIYGPGSFYVIWVQGCSIRCKGCWNTQFWSKEGGRAIPVTELVQKALNDRNNGISIVGGEPLDQVEGTLALVKLAKQSGLLTMVYTGYEEDEILKDEMKKLVIETSDIAVIGRYVENLRSTFLKWRGSSNQKVIINNPQIEMEEDIQEVEVEIAENGRMVVTGYPTEEIWEVLL